MSTPNNSDTAHHTVTNVVIYDEDDLMPEVGLYEDIGFVVNDLYCSKTRDLVSARMYAARMVRSYFQISFEEAITEFEIIVVPFGNIYEESGRILARRVR